MSLLRIIDIILIIVLLMLGIETFIQFKKNENKLIQDISKSLLVRINIIIGLTIVLAVFTFINIFSEKNITGIENYDQNYLKKYKSIYFLFDTIDLYSMYNHSFIEFGNCEDNRLKS